MTDRRSRRLGLLREGAVIVASILLAFTIDAWWDGRAERADTHEALRAVEAELRENLAYFAAADTVWRRAAEAGGALLHLTGPQATVADAEQVKYLIGEMWRRPDLEPPGTGATSALVVSGSLARVESTELRQALSLWPAFIEKQREWMDVAGGDDLFYRRMLLFVAQLDWELIGGQASLSEARSAFRELAPERSAFPSDWAGLLADRQFESGVTSRTSAVLAARQLSARTRARIEEILALIDAELR